MLGAVLLGSALIPSQAFAKIYDIEVFNDKSAKKALDVLDDARDGTLPQDFRAGLTQAKEDIPGTKKRLVAQRDLIRSEVGAALKKDYWWEASAALRREVGTMRGDISYVADTLPRAQKRQALLLKKTLVEKIDAFDVACGQGIRSNKADKEQADKLYSEVLAALDKTYSAIQVA